MYVGIGLHSFAATEIFKQLGGKPVATLSSSKTTEQVGVPANHTYTL